MCDTSKAKTGLGKSHREGISWVKLMRMFPNDATAEKWFVQQRWGGKSICPHCGCKNVQVSAKHPTMPYRCRKKGCRKRFSVKVGTVMHRSNLGYQIWAMAIYIMSTGIKGVSSMKLHRDLGITQKSAWHLAMRIRKTWDKEHKQFFGPVEVDETYVGGKRKNMSKAKRKELEGIGRGTVGKATVVGIKDRGTNQFQLQVVTDTTGETLVAFVNSTSKEDAVTYTDDFRGYQMLKRAAHETVKHSVGEYVNEEAHINGMEFFWTLLKRGYYGTYHRMSPKHLQRYVNEFVGRHNIRDLDTIKQMESIAKGFDGKRLTYKMLTRKTKLNSTAV